MSASLAFQAWARGHLVADTAVTALLPAANIFDSNGRPEVTPRVALGEDQELPADDVVGRYTRLFATLHVWQQEPGLAGVKAIAGALRVSLRRQRWESGGYRCNDLRFESARFLRDPDGVTAHGVVTFRVLLEELP
jgi:hypothetical protein